MSDLISRQATVEQFRKSLCALETEGGREYGISFSGVERILKSLPSAERKGKWIYLDCLDAFVCSVCGSMMVRNIFDYCPWCGARMEKTT